MAEEKKMVFKISIHCSKCKTAIFQAVTKLEGINQVTVDGEKGTVTVVGDADPCYVAESLRKKVGRPAMIESVGPNKKEEKKDDEKDEKKDEKKDLPHCCKNCSGRTVIFTEPEPGCAIM